MTASASIPVRAWIDMILLALVWGAIFLFIELALEDLTPFWIVFHRVFWAAIVLWAVVAYRRLIVPKTLGVWAAFFVMGALNNVMPFVLITWGQTEIESGLASILNATTAFFGVLVAAAFLADERLTVRRVVGVVFGVIGVAVIIGVEALSSFDPRSLGQLAIIGAAISYAFAGVWARLRMKGLTPTVSAAGMLSGSALIMLPLAFAAEGPPSIDLAPSTIGVLAYISVAGTAFAYLLYYRILAAAGAGNLLLVTIVMPPISIVLGAAILGERLTAETYLGCGLIALGLVILDGRAAALLGKARPRA